MRIVAGIHGGRRLRTPVGETTRPTTDRVREALFNIVFSMGGIDDAAVLDLYAGSGAFGLEALSRGAGSACFVERDRAAVECIEDNIETLGVESSTSVIRSAVDPALAGSLRGRRFDVVFADPPYAHDAWNVTAAAIVPLLAPGALVIFESDHEIEIPEPLEKLSVRRYGGTVITFAEAAEAVPESQE